jgi:CelD/BcsL family acetyltransferase involved in cellulose biosynthesis
MSTTITNQAEVKHDETPSEFHFTDLTVRVRTDQKDLDSLETEWKSLTYKSDQLLCMSYSWVTCWWKHFGRHQNRSLYLVTVYDDAKLVAIFPFYKGSTVVGKYILQDRLQLLGSGGSPNEQLGFNDDYGISDFLDLIVDPEYNDAVAKVFVSQLDGAVFGGNQITFHQVRDDSFVMKHVYPLLKRTNRKIQCEITDVCYSVNLHQAKNFTDFVNSSKSSARRRFRQTLKSNGTEDGYTIEVPENNDHVSLMISNLISLHQHRWNKLGYPGAFHDTRFKSFFEELCNTAYDEGRLWIKQTVDECGVSAVRMLIKFNDRYFDYMSGFDEGSISSRYRPGIGLLLDVVQDAYNQNTKHIELMRGDEGYKQDFSNSTWVNRKIVIQENLQFQTGWGVSTTLLHWISDAMKILNREKILISVQYQQNESLSAYSKYFLFRFNTVVRKMKAGKVEG